MNKYQQIIVDTIAQIDRMQLRKGQRLPSVRQLAAHYRCSKDTVQKALRELAYQRYIYPIAKSGYYVLSDASHQEVRPIALHRSLPDQAQFSFDDFRLCLSESVSTEQQLLFDYAASQLGWPALRTAMQQHFHEHSVYVGADDIAITSGGQQALYVLLQMPDPWQRQTVLLEQPTYPRMVSLVKQLGIPYRTIERTPNGIDLTAVAELFRTERIRYFYTIPRFHYPLGCRYEEHQKKQLVALAQQHHVTIIEDDYMADFDHPRSAPLHYYDTANCVIYLKTFSSIIFPALRLAAVALPDALQQPFLQYKQLSDYDTNVLLQRALTLYYNNGMFAKHRQQQLAMHQRKCAALQRVLHQVAFRHWPVQDTKIAIPLAAQSELPALKRLLQQRATIDWLESCYINECPNHYVKIDVRLTPLHEIDTQVHTLWSLLHPFIAEI